MEAAYKVRCNTPCHPKLYQVYQVHHRTYMIYMVLTIIIQNHWLFTGYSLVIHWAAAHESFQLKHPGDEEEPLAIGPWWDGPGFCGPVVLKTYCQTITFLLNCS